MIVGGATPKSGPLTIDGVDQTGTLSWLDRREAVLVNLGTDGTVEAAGETYAMGRCDMLYLGMGTGAVTVSGPDAHFYIISAPAHRAIAARLVTIDDAAPGPVGRSRHQQRARDLSIRASCRDGKLPDRDGHDHAG